MQAGLYIGTYLEKPWDVLLVENLIKIDNEQLTFIDKNLKGSLVISKDIKAIKNEAGKNCNLEGLFTKGSIYEIGTSAFENSKNLLGFSGIDKAQTIGRYAFNECPSFTLPTIPLNAKFIGTKAFFNNSTFCVICYNKGQIEKDAFDENTLITFLDTKESLLGKTFTEYFLKESLDELLAKNKTFKEINSIFRDNKLVK